MKVPEAIRLLEHEGHRQFRHPTKPDRVTLSGSVDDDTPKGTFASVKRQASLKGVK